MILRKSHDKTIMAFLFSQNFKKYQFFISSVIAKLNESFVPFSWGHFRR